MLPKKASATTTTSTTSQRRCFKAVVLLRWRRVAVTCVLVSLTCLYYYKEHPPKPSPPTTTTTTTRSKHASNLLSLNPECTMAQDILSVRHLPELGQIEIILRENSKCPHPHLMGRLSGPALVMMKFSTTNTSTSSSTTTTTVVGSYTPVPLAGRYFLEIIVVMCHDFSLDLQFNFTKTCVEHPQRNRLLGDHAHIQIQIQRHVPKKEPSSSASSSVWTGFWLHNAPNETYAPVYTRYQPKECLPLALASSLKISDTSTAQLQLATRKEDCSATTSRKRFEPYKTYQYYRYDSSSSNQTILSPTNPFPNKSDNKSPVLWAQKPTTLCLVGDSHSRNLYQSLIQHHHISPENNNVLVTYPLTSKHPRNVHTKTIAASLGACHKIILAVGQWPVSFQQKPRKGDNPNYYEKPTLFATYHREIQSMLTRLQDYYHDARRSSDSTTDSNSMEIILRSIHYNPLNALNSGVCPPMDWRNPTVVDGYNAILQQAVEEYNNNHTASDADASLTQQGRLKVKIRFVDTNFIVGAMWDASLDWGHVPPLATHVESLYLLGVAIGVIQS
mgnify:CR=1 FL=1